VKSGNLQTKSTLEVGEHWKEKCLYVASVKFRKKVRHNLVTEEDSPHNLRINEYIIVGLIDKMDFKPFTTRVSP
jgi:hypothetical protein